jgi:general secretion pathway protein G
MTLIEIMIVVVIMALVATGAGMGAMAAYVRAQIRTTETAVHNVRSAVFAYQLAGLDGCPTVDQLRAERMLDRQASATDSWNHAFAIECAEGDVVVRSAGPDGVLGTDDDIPDKT